jgi:hypothetical protein
VALDGSPTRSVRIIDIAGEGRAEPPVLVRFPASN